MRMLVLVTTLLIFVQLVIAATMRHQHAGLAIPDFPTAYGKIWPDISANAVASSNARRVSVTEEAPVTAFQIELQMAHRIAALTIFILIAVCAWQAWRRLGGKDLLAKLAIFWLGLIVFADSSGCGDDLDEQSRRCRDGPRHGRRAFARDRRPLVPYWFWPFDGVRAGFPDARCVWRTDVHDGKQVK